MTTTVLQIRHARPGGPVPVRLQRSCPAGGGAAARCRRPGGTDERRSRESASTRVMVALVDHAGHNLWKFEQEGKAPKTDADWQVVWEHAVQIAAAGAAITVGGTGPSDADWVKSPILAHLRARRCRMPGSRRGVPPRARTSRHSSPRTVNWSKPASRATKNSSRPCRPRASFTATRTSTRKARKSCRVQKDPASNAGQA